jgi:PAS domain S-box-containing protein
MGKAVEPLNLPDKPSVNILLVDDQRVNLLALEALLKDLGHNLVSVSSGEEALRQLDRSEFAVVLLDVQMEGLSGFDTARQIRRRDKDRHTPIIFVTAHEADRHQLEEAYGLGAVDYLVRPIIPVILRAKVMGFVELFHKSEQIKQQAERLRQIERREFEEKLARENARLQESEQRFARFMQHLPGLAWAKDLAGRYVYVNEAAEAAFNIPRAQLYGKTDAEVFPRRTAAEFMENDRKALASPAGVKVIEELQHTDGVVHQSIVSKFPIPGPDGRPALLGGMAIDITDRKQLEEELRRRAEQLQEADRRKDEFLAMLSHELRNPLAPVRNALHIMKLPGAGAVAVRHAREIVERQIQHLVRLVDDLLDVSRIMQDKIELHKEEVELTVVVGRAIETAQPAIDAQGHQLDVAIPDTPIRVVADIIRLSQVISNLLTNAAKYTDQAGRLWLAVEREQNQAVIRVRDTGIGMPPELLPRVFDLFVQADRSLARSQGGLGIGLTLVKRLVEMHGGTVTALSPGPGQGSEFIIRLPALPEPPGLATGATAEPGYCRPPGPRRRILVVDDSVDTAESAAMVLRMAGHEVRVAHDGPSALDTVQTFRPEILLLDIGLPGMSGYEVARRLRAQPEGQTLVLAAMTGYGHEDDRRRSQEAGFDVHLTKPLDPTILEAFVAAPHASTPWPG